MKQENVTYNQEENIIEAEPQIFQMLQQANKDFKRTILNSLMDLVWEVKDVLTDGEL